MDRIFLRLGPNGALGADNLQWILYRPKRTVPPADDAALRTKDWIGVSFVRSTKAVLARCIHEKTIELSPDGKIAFDRLADDFDAWKADPAQEGRPVPDWPPMAPTPAENDFLMPPEKRDRGRPAPTMIERLGPRVAIGTDGLQWIVYKAVSRPNASWRWQDEAWDAVGFIHSSKRALISCLEAKGLEISVAGQAALARQPDKIWRWQRAP